MLLIVINEYLAHCRNYYVLTSYTGPFKRQQKKPLIKLLIMSTNTKKACKKTYDKAFISNCSIQFSNNKACKKSLKKTFFDTISNN